MQIHRYIIELAKKDDPINIEPMGCIHVGNINFAKDKFLERVNFIKSDDTRYFIGKGDYADAITATPGGITDPRFDVKTIDPEFDTPDRQYEFIYDNFEPIKEKCIGLEIGNHDWKLIQKNNHDFVIKDLCKPLNVKYLGAMCFIHLRATYRKKVIRDYIIWSAHGAYSGGFVGADINKMISLSAGFDADIYLTGHTHQIATLKRIQLLYDYKTNNTFERTKIFAKTGAFLRGYQKDHESYLEKNPKLPLKVGTITITLFPEQGTMFGIE